MVTSESAQTLEPDRATHAALEQLALGQPTLGLENRFRCKDASYRRLGWLRSRASCGRTPTGFHPASVRVRIRVPVLEALVDETRVNRVLANLLANAIKYSPKGGPARVTVKDRVDPDGKSALLVVR